MNDEMTTAVFHDTQIAPEAVQAHTMVPVLVNGRKVVLARVEEVLLAFDSQCPHASADLTEGELYRWKVTCPDHGYCFDVRNGRVLYPEDEFYRLKQYALKVEAGTVWVQERK